MVSFTEFSRSAQRTICLLVAVVVVTASLTLGVFGVQRAQHDGYSVTITQLR